MKINCTTTFLDGKDRFEKDDMRTVSEEDGARFIKNGWAVAAGDAPGPLPDLPAVDMNIHKSVMGQEVRHG